MHRAPGLLEAAYEACLAHELALRGLQAARQVMVAVDYKGLRVEGASRMDLVVEGRVVVEIKSVEKVAPVHEAQLLTYLRLSGLGIGLLFNFNAKTLKEGLVRRAL